ncbi:cytochrome c oxidase subunit II [Brevundimonas subvibrioides]|uniref:Cytochrome c oxidase subunit 2 n=1 Tax=Brevundimonas subvibrioides (strain ATCC 15264 / DSM 4735 / LMG 14903 / NBRC 16000 / CB 81) TaxID=633149 RepID=D9QME5_BRESC|nr:cytochrome c oxidase subunit II [Brevundimonas subvibrioides]ADL00115.1 cytochrome c oxidase, subunit II [Brevundimonas subvibrioides ATCC 15264]
MGLGTRALSKTGHLLGAASLAVFFATPTWAQDLMGQPTPGGIDLQPAASPLKHEAIFFHNVILMPIIVGICVLVLGLLAWIVIRYNEKSNPVPAKWSHNTVVEIIWTVLPVMILVGISLFSFRLLFAYHDTPPVDLTIKATGNQWNWAYEYPDQGVSEYISNMLPEDEAIARGVPYRLAADEPLVVPVGKTVRVLVTAADVIHAFAMPAFGLKTDAVPGRVNETWFKAERTGVFYGQCSELCGVDHAFMPIQINVVTEAEFAAWVASKGGSMTAAADAAATAAAAPAAAAAPVAPAAADAATPAVAEAPNPAAPSTASAPTASTTPAPAAAAPAAQ